MTINGITVPPDFIYNAGGGLVDADRWKPLGYGEELVRVPVATAPTINAGSPYLGWLDDSVLSNASDYYQAGNNTFGAITTEDLVILLLLRATGTTSVILAKRNAAVGYEVGIDASDRLYFTLEDASGATNVVSAALTAGVHHMAMFFGDRSGSGQWYVDGVASGAAVDISARALTLNSATAFAVGADSAGNSPFDSRLGAVFLWKHAAWLDTHLQAAVALERSNLLTGIHPHMARGTGTPTVQTRGSVAHLDKIESDGTRRIYQVGSGALRMCDRIDSEGKRIKGYLPEVQITNLCLRSEEIDVFPWSKINCSITNTSTTTLPNGDTSSNDVVHEDATAADVHYILQPSLSVTGGTKYVLSVWAKAINRSWISMYHNNTAVSAWFDLTNGTVGTTIDTDDAGMVSYGNGWYRCWMSLTGVVTSASKYVLIRVADADNGLAFNGANQDSVYFWGVQFEAGVDYPTSYMPTAGCEVIREEDVLRYKGDDGNLGGVGSNKTAAAQSRILVPSYNLATDLSVFAVSDGGVEADRILSYINTSNQMRVSGNDIFVGTVDDVVNNVVNKTLVTWEKNNVIIDVNNSYNSDTIATIPDELDRIDIGVDNTSAAQLNGLIADVEFWPRKRQLSITSGEEEAMIYFTRNAATGTSPLITAAAAADADFIWTGPGGTFYGKQPDIANFPAGDFTLRSTAWGAVTAIDFTDRKLTAFEIDRILARLTAITSLSAYSNAALVGDISGWVLPSSVTDMNIRSTLLSGDISGWTLPATLNNMYLRNTSVGGDISGWTLPATLEALHLSSTSVSGDISGWTLPATLTQLLVHTTSVSGDISGWVLPAGLAFLQAASTSLDYGSSGALATATRNSSTYELHDCAMIEAEVNRILADCVDSGTTGSDLNIAGSNAAPTGGAANADLVQLRKAIIDGGLGWTVTVTV